jgi:hypothetical protein
VPQLNQAFEQALSRAGKHAQAATHLRTATAMYGEMGMPFWLEQAQAAVTS